MTDAQDRRLRDTRVRVLIALIGVHSCLLGVCMLAAPKLMLGLLGFSAFECAFFPLQSGVFLLILGIFYLRALTRADFIDLILLSKAAAVIFLVSYAVLARAHVMIWAAALGDFGMLACLSAALRRSLTRIP